MKRITTSRRGFFAMSTSLAALLAGCGAQKADEAAQAHSDESDQAPTPTENAKRESISDDTNGGHAIAVSAEEKSFAAVDVTKTGDDDGDEADFYGTNAAVYAEEGARLTLDDITVTTDGQHANAVFSYGEGTTVTISNSTIETTSNCSGGIMVTGGGTLVANDLTVHTTGNSSAPIRSDRGGGTQTVTGGTYTSNGVGSPVIYSTAEVSVSGATLESTSSQGVVVEGKNSVMLNDCTLTAHNDSKNSDKSDWYQAVMIYQSMSGDAAEGEAHFGAKQCSVANANGDVFFVNNTICTIELENNGITNEDASGNFLRAAAAGWGNQGSNGGQVTLTAKNQQINGTMLVDDVSNLNLYLSEGSAFAGCINPEGAQGDVYVQIEDGSTWELTADAYITSLACGTDAISLNGYTLMVGESAYAESTTSSGTAIEHTAVATSNGGPGGAPDGGPGGAPGGAPGGGEPPAKPGE